MREAVASDCRQKRKIAAFEMRDFGVPPTQDTDGDTLPDICDTCPGGVPSTDGSDRDFDGLGDLPSGALELPSGMALEARYADISDQLERKAAGIRVYASQIQRRLIGVRRV